MYKLVLIDADNTLFDYNKAEKYALETTLREFGCKENLEEIRNDYKVINKGMWQDLENGKVTKEVLRTERFRRLFDKNGFDIPVEQFSRRYLDHLSDTSFLIRDAEEVCDYLSQKYKLVLVTNGIKDVQYSRLNKSVIKQYFHEIVISDDIGYSKPDPAFFDYTMDIAGHTDKSTTIIIGDSLSSDMRGGISYGIDTCWFNFESVTNETALNPKYQIGELKDLYRIL
jgi:YjjG family noncanonical pyrimidine nucleotidase